MSGWRRMVPVAVQGASSTHGVEGEPGRPGGGVGFDDLGGEREAAQVLAQALEARRGDVDGGDAGAGCGQGRGLAAGRGAQVGNVEAGDIAGDARHQGGAGILHPPGALGVARRGPRCGRARTGGSSRSAAGGRRAARPSRRRRT